jgi:hypothetical protein
MSTVTYSEPSVVDTICGRFVPVQINVTEETAKPLIARFHQFWTPDLRRFDADGDELYRWNGFLPPFEFVPQLLVAQGQACLRLSEAGGAAATYEEVLCRFPTSHVAAEAAYFLAVARYKTSGKPNDLADGWKELQSRYPDSPWRLKEVFSEAA